MACRKLFSFCQCGGELRIVVENGTGLVVCRDCGNRKPASDDSAHPLLASDTKQPRQHQPAVEAQELIGRTTDQERAARDRPRQQLDGEIAGTVPPPSQPPDQPILGGDIGEPGSREEQEDTGGPSREHPDPFFAALARGEEIPFAQPREPEHAEDELAARMSADAGLRWLRRTRWTLRRGRRRLKRTHFQDVMTSDADARIALTVST
jgi:hypothetical protein